MIRCSRLVLTGEVRKNPWDPSKSVEVREPCGAEATHQLVVMTDDLYGDDSYNGICPDHLAEAEELAASDSSTYVSKLVAK